LPDGPIRAEILAKVLLVRSLRPLGSLRAASAQAKAPDAAQAARAPVVGMRYVVGIASSTGGPSALLELFSRMPARFPGAILIAQHMPDKFTKTFAERLGKKGAIPVVEAQDGEPVVPRKAYVCPGKLCMEVHPVAGGAPSGGPIGELRIKVVPPAPTDRYIPSADRLFKSISAVAGNKAVGVILTGMGEDGVHGARAIRAGSGIIVAESEETAVVYGMPGAAVRAGVVHESLPLTAIADYLAQLA
jgi:two-component system chemotaxis response regulator CheB